MNKFNLEERCVVFAENVIITCKRLIINPFNRRIIDQLIGSSGSIGANYCEASEAESKKDFRHKMCIVKKGKVNPEGREGVLGQIKETKHWLRLLSKAHTEIREEIRIHWKEVHELLLIFSKSINTSKGQKQLLNIEKLDVE